MFEKPSMCALATIFTTGAGRETVPPAQDGDAGAAAADPTAGVTCS